MRHSHTMCLINNNDDDKNSSSSFDLSPLYEKIGVYLSDGYGVIYAAEQNPSEAIQTMIRMGIIDEDHIENGTLVAISPETVYAPQKTKMQPHAIIDSWLALISKMKKNHQLKGILIVGSMDIFFKKDNEKKGVEYEQTIGKQFEIPIEVLCYYTLNSVAHLPLSTLISVLSAHQFTIHSGCNYYEWHHDKIVKIIALALDKVLGNSASNLVLKTLKLIYTIDAESIAVNPELFENTIRKLFKNSADLILDSISIELKKEMVFYRNTMA